MPTEMFMTSVITLGIGFLTAALGVMYKSKCSSCDVCGIHIKRSIDAEVKEDLAMLKRSETVSPVAPTMRRNSH